jgi:hypothetical protein
MHDPPTKDDFAPISRTRAEAMNISELERTGLSHYRTIGDAQTWQTKEGSLIAKVRFKPDSRVYIARTDLDKPGHFDVWARSDEIEEMAETAEIVA